MDEMKKEEIQRVQESLDGYNKELELQLRKVKAFEKKRDIVVKHPQRVKPMFAFEELDAYWEAQSELHLIAFDEDIYKTNKMITTIKETIPNLEDSLKRLKGDEE